MDKRDISGAEARTIAGNCCDSRVEEEIFYRVDKISFPISLTTYFGRLVIAPV